MLVVNNFIIKLIITFITSSCLSLWLNKKIIHIIRIYKIKEKIRNLGIKGEAKKQKATSLGGFIIILSTLIPICIFTKLSNKYTYTLVFTTLIIGCLGLYDDYIKIFKKNKKGVTAKFKIIYQSISGLFISYILLSYDNFIIQENKYIINNIYVLKTYPNILNKLIYFYTKHHKIFFQFIVILLIILITNSTNLTDGIDGLLGSLSVIILLIIIIFLFISSNKILANYINITYMPNMEDVIIFTISLLGSIISFLWYNCYPAKLFMGDCGSLTVGGIITILSIMIKQKIIIMIMLLIPIIESITVIIQVLYFKYTKMIHGKGKRIFIMTPIHHHFQKKGYHENTIFSRFIIIQICLTIIIVLLLRIC
jgi:phospho-N-acetylmuramoyl-pentapeptide-transferase